MHAAVVARERPAGRTCRRVRGRATTEESAIVDARQLLKNPKELTRPPFSYTRCPMPSKFARKARFTAPPFVQIRTPRPDAPAGNEPSKKLPATVSTSPRHRRQTAPFPTGWNAARRYKMQVDSYSLFHVEHFVSIYCKYLLQIPCIM